MLVSGFHNQNFLAPSWTTCISFVIVFLGGGGGGDGGVCVWCVVTLLCDR